MVIAANEAHHAPDFALAGEASATGETASRIGDHSSRSGQFEALEVAVRLRWSANPAALHCRRAACPAAEWTGARTKRAAGADRRGADAQSSDPLSTHFSTFRAAPMAVRAR